MTTPAKHLPPSGAYVGASWASLLLGSLGFVVGLWNAELALAEKGFYFAVLMQGLFAVVSLQKAVRDRLEGIPVTPIYYGLAWTAVAVSFSLLGVGLWNAGMSLSEKGFYAMAFTLAAFATVTTQKAVRDRAAFPRTDDVYGSPSGTDDAA